MPAFVAILVGGLARSVVRCGGALRFQRLERAEQFAERARRLVALAFLVRIAHQLAQVLAVGIGMRSQQLGHLGIAVVAQQGVAQGLDAVHGRGLLARGLAILGHRVADRVQFVVVQLAHLLGQERDLAVTVGEQPADMASIAKKMNSTTLGEMGLTLQDLTDEIAGQFGYRKDQGVLIADVEADSPAAQVGLQAGQLIEEVNRVRVRSLKELQQALKQAGQTRQVLLRVRAGEHSQYVVLRGE